MTVSEYIFSFLKNKQVETVFMVSGGQAMYLNDALARIPEINTICTHHEQSAAMAAEAYGRVSGKLGVALVTAGPGSVNTITGLVGGWTDSSPMMIISGQSPYSFVKYQENSGIRQYGVQGIYIKPYVESATKYFKTIDDPANIQYCMEEAYYYATSGRPGPVWIDVPLDIQRMQVPEKLLQSFIPQPNAPDKLNLESLAEKVIDSITKAKRPLIIAGQGIRISKTNSLLHTLIETLNIPVVTTRLGIDIIESDHPLYVGRPGNYGDRSANFAVQQCDCLLSLGSRLSTSSVGHDAKEFAHNAYKIVIDVDHKELIKPGIQIDMQIEADLASFMPILVEKATKKPLSTSKEWAERCSRWKKSYPVVLPEYKTQVPINSYYFTDRLSAKSLPSDMILVDTGSCFHVVCQTWKIKKGQRFLTTGGLSSMGYWVAGMGACTASHRANTIVVTGDGSLQMNIQEFATIKYNNLPIKVFIFNNDGYLLIRHTQKNFFDSRLFGEGPQSGLWCPDSMKIAEAYGIKAVRIEKLEEIDSKIDEVLAYNGPVICDIKTDPWQLLIPRVSSEKLADGSLVAKPFDDMFPFLSRDEYERNISLR